MRYHIHAVSAEKTLHLYAESRDNAVGVADALYALGFEVKMFVAVKSWPSNAIDAETEYDERVLTVTPPPSARCDAT